jgi:hypothetical protein
MCDTEQQTPIENDESQTVIQEKKSKEDNYLENWTKTNYKVLITYNRKEIATYSRTVQKAILRSFSPEKRKEIWQSKVDYLSSSSDFTKEENKYLDWFAVKFKNLSYNKAFDQDLAQEMYDKAVAGIDKFGWSKAQVHKMFFTVGNVNDNENQSKRELVDVIDPGGNGTWCECYYDLGCPNWDCDSGANCDDGSDPGDDSPHDCGVFGGTDCDGNC